MGKTVQLTIAIAFSCLSGCGLAGSSLLGPPPPAGITLESAGGSVRVDWSPVSDALYYRIYWSTTPGIDPDTDPSVVRTHGPYVIPDVTGTYSVAIATADAGGEGSPSGVMSVEVATGSPEKYFPTWALNEPTHVIPFDYDGGRTSAENAANLQAAINALQPGDRLEIGPGTYSSSGAFSISPRGTEQAPIWIVAKAGASPVLTRPDASHNTLEFGTAHYVLFRGIEITGGSIAVRLYDCHDVWMDQCHVHHSAENAITANTNPTHHLYFTRNEIHDTAGTGEGFYIGGNFSSPVANNVVIAMNHVYNTFGHQGDGIEIKQGSWGCWVAENVVHDNNYPSILVYGTDGNPPNLIERNICWNSGDNVIQIQGEAIVRNNVAMNGNTAFFSSDHQGSTRDLVVVNNTFVNGGSAAVLTSWDGRTGMRFSNNACYSQFASSIWFGGGSTGVGISGNVVVGSVGGASGGFTAGAGLSDFTNVSWDAGSRDVTPSAMGALDGAADEVWAPLDDLEGNLRVPPYDAGASETP